MSGRLAYLDLGTSVYEVLVLAAHETYSWTQMRRRTDANGHWISATPSYYTVPTRMLRSYAYENKKHG